MQLNSKRSRKLSVSTIGTSELQHLYSADIADLRFGFQFPQSERVNCNTRSQSYREHSLTLSVSTIGTSELQHFDQVLFSCTRKCFQFPQSERVNCNAVLRRGSEIPRTLSVSTIGTSELQLALWAHEHRKDKAFSFHNRNE